MTKNEVEMQMKSLIGEEEFKKYKDFAFREDMFKLAVGVMLGTAFNKVVHGFSDYLIMPIFTFLVSQTGDEWRKWCFTPMKGLTFELGNLAGAVVDFVLISIVLYLFYVKIIQGVFHKEKRGPETKQCPLCLNPVHALALKCPFCTGDLTLEPRRNRKKNTGTKNRRGE